MSGKYTHSGKRSFGSKSVFLILALILAIGCTIGGTLAWLTAQTGDIENTFVAGQIGALGLNEEADQITTTEGHQFIVIPGVDITKDPKVTYTPAAAAGTVPVDAYVFVKLTGIGQGKWTLNGDQYEIKNENNEVVLSFKIADGWTPVPNVSDVYFKAVPAGDMVGTKAEGETTVTGVSIIAGDKIEVSHKITEDDVETVAAAADKLTFTAYAIQQQGFDTVTAAWNEVSGANTSTTP